MIRFACPKCRTAFRVRADKAGKRTTCPACGQRLRVPGSKRTPASTRRRAEPAESAAGPGLLPLILAGCLLVALAGVVAAAGFALTRPAPAAPVVVTPFPDREAERPTTSADSSAESDSPDPKLFETPPRNDRSLPAARQAQLQRQYEPIYLDPTADDAEHIAAANRLLGLPRGYTSLVKGLAVYEGRPEYRRRYRWCLKYLCVVQHDRDQAAPAPGGESSGIIPARHLPAMLELVRDVNPDKRPERAEEFYTTLKYLAQHGEGAAPLLPTLRVMQARFAGNDAVAGEVQEAIRGVEQRQ